MPTEHIESVRRSGWRKSRSKTRATVELSQLETMKSDKLLLAAGFDLTRVVDDF